MLSRLKFLRLRALKIIIAVAFILFLIISRSFWALTQPKSVSSWGSANAVAPAEMVRAALLQNYLPLKTQKPLDENQIKALKVPSLGAETLYIIDFNSPQLCGTGGCLYAVYTQQGRSVLRLLLNPKLPKKTPLFAVSEQSRNGFYCLVVAQSTGKEDTVSRSRYCYEGTGFTLVNSSITKGGV
ncbi:MAG TPA: hypothetical protein V6D48_12630 [Oculatellaceae cyanobacterium]